MKNPVDEIREYYFDNLVERESWHALVEIVAKRLVDSLFLESWSKLLSDASCSPLPGPLMPCSSFVQLHASQRVRFQSGRPLCVRILGYPAACGCSAPAPSGWPLNRKAAVRPDERPSIDASVDWPGLC